MYCPSCGNKVDDSSAFCSSCGSRISASANKNPNMKSKNNRNGWMVAIVVLLVLILLSVFVLGFVLYSQSNDRDEREESIEYDRDTEDRDYDDREDNNSDTSWKREEENNDSNCGYTEEEIEDSRERADKDLLDSVYVACCVAYSDPEITELPKEGQIISDEVFENTDWGREVCKVLGMTDFSDLEKKLKSKKAGNHIEVYCESDGNFIVTAGEITVTS